jgi:hypothetical protein
MIDRNQKPLQYSLIIVLSVKAKHLYQLIDLE